MNANLKIRVTQLAGLLLLAAWWMSSAQPASARPLPPGDPIGADNHRIDSDAAAHGGDRRPRPPVRLGVPAGGRDRGRCDAGRRLGPPRDPARLVGSRGQAAASGVTAEVGRR